MDVDIRGRLQLGIARGAGIVGPVPLPRVGTAAAPVALGHRILDRASLLVVLKVRDHIALVMGSERGAVIHPLKNIREFLQFSCDIIDPRNSVSGRLFGITEAVSSFLGTLEPFEDGGHRAVPSTFPDRHFSSSPGFWKRKVSK